MDSFIKYRVSRIALFLLVFGLPFLFYAQNQQNNLRSNAAGTTLAFTVFLHGVGNGGDNASAGTIGNTNPYFKQRTINVSVANSNNQVIARKDLIVTFNQNSGNFLGSADFGTLATGSYTMTVKADRYLRVAVPGIQNLKSSQQNQIPPVYLIAGDIDGDNVINIVDFNILMGCYSDLSAAKSCTQQQKVMADLTDDTNVNQLDYNLFIREIGNRSGSGAPTVAPTTAPTVATTQTTTPTQTASDPSARLFTGDFETGNFNQWRESQATGSWSHQIVSSPKRQGSYAARFELRDGDCPITGGTCYGERTERGAGSESGGKEGDERWYQWSTQFSTTFPQNHTWGLVSQWHAEADGSPPVSFNVEGVGTGNWGLSLHKQDRPGNYLAVYYPWKASLAPGTWQDIKLHIKWSTSDTIGFIELWHNGVKQTFTGAPCAGQTKCMVRTLVPGGGGTYFKQGYYRDQAVNGTGILYHDGFSAAKTEAGLNPL